MNRMMRMRRYNSSSKKYDVLFPQTITGNILRQEDGGVLETDLLQYDRHLISNKLHFNKAKSSGTPRKLEVTLPGVELIDGLTLLLTLHCDVECEPTLTFNGGEAVYIVSGDGDNIPGGQAEGTIMLLAWSSECQKWILLSSDTYSDITKVLLPVESEYVHVAIKDDDRTIVIPGFDKNTDKVVLNYGQTILRAGIDYSFQRKSVNTIELTEFGLRSGDALYCLITKYIATSKRGSLKYDLDTRNIKVTIDHDGVKRVAMPDEISEAHSVVVNYGQTILRNTLDYNIVDDGAAILLNEMTLNTGDVLMFTITKFVESNADLVPNNWGATGNYRYSMNVIHTEYTATEDNITVIPVPGFNYKKDDIWPIQDNKLFIYDVDYTVDDLGQVVLLKTQLNRDETLYFTILQGSMMDVPNFNVIRASGDSGQHLLLDMSYNVLCNYYTILVWLKHDLETNPTVKCIDGPAEPVCDCFGNPILGGYKAGSYLWLVYNYEKNCWYSLSHSQLDITSLMPEHLTTSGTANFVGKSSAAPGVVHETTIEHGLGMKPSSIEVRPCEPPTTGPGNVQTTIGDIWSYADDKYLYVGNSGESTSKFEWMVSSQNSTADLRTYIDQQIAEAKAAPGRFETRQYVYTAEEDDITSIPAIDGFRYGIDKIIVNYGQTLLREGIDYELTPDNGIQFVNIILAEGDIIQATIIVQEPNI